MQKERTQVLAFCQRINTEIEQAYHSHIFKRDDVFCNTLALSERYHSLSAVNLGYNIICQLIQSSFFDYRSAVFTEKSVSENKIPCSFEDILDALEPLENALVQGNLQNVSDLSNYLFMRILKTSYDLSLCKECLSRLHSSDIRICMLYQLQPPVETIYDIEQYLRIEDCCAAVTNRLQTLCSQKNASAHIASRISREAVYHIRVHYREPLSLDSIAAALYVSPSHLSRVFNRDLKMSIHQYISVIRIEHAKRLLHETAMPINKIAVSIGLSSPLHFNRLFKHHTGMTPSAYRELRNR